MSTCIGLSSASFEALLPPRITFSATSFRPATVEQNLFRLPSARSILSNGASKVPVKGIGMAELLTDIVKAVGSPLATAILAWLVGHRLSAKWGWWQKRREQAQTASNDIYRLYGEFFFAVWKLWNYSIEGTDSDTDARWELLHRAAAAEASMEALLVKVACERTLSSEELADLGRFRQAYQQLRQTIRDRRRLEWRHSEHPEYAAFKRLSAQVASICATLDAGELPSRYTAAAQLRTITSNQWEAAWSS